MKKASDSSTLNSNEEFINDYQAIVNPSQSTVVVKIEWTQQDDIFQKLSMYDNTYIPVSTLGGTTLINTF